MKTPKAEPRSWEEREQALFTRLRASGRTVRKKDSSDTETYRVTFPRRRTPSRTKQKECAPTKSIDAEETNVCWTREPITHDEALEGLLQSEYLHLLLSKEELSELAAYRNKHPDSSFDELIEEFPDLGDLLNNQVQGNDDCLSFELISDDDPSWVRGWGSYVYGFGGIWTAITIEIDTEYFTDRYSAISQCYDWAHEVIESETHYPLKDFM